MAAPEQQSGGSRQADPDRAARSGRARRSRSMVAWSGACWCASCSTSAMRKPPIASRATPRRRRRAIYRVDTAFHRRLDRAALPARSRRPPPSISPISREGTINPHALGARRLLAGPRRRSHGPARAGQGLLRGGGATHRHLLRPACARAARPDRSRPARPADLHAARAERPRQSRSRARGAKFSTRSTSATCWHRSLPSSAKAAPTSPAWRCWASSPPNTTTAAPCCCSARPPTRAACRSTITPIRPSACPITQPIAPPIEAAVAYSIARQESHFNQKVVSSAHAMGLMQVTPAAGIDTAAQVQGRPITATGCSRTRSTTCRWARPSCRTCSPAITGSYILTFAGYNAGAGRVRQWIAAYGDPRDPNVDPVDWVERIPLSETRNYVAADHGEPAGLSRALRRRHQAADRSRPQARRR